MKNKQLLSILLVIMMTTSLFAQSHLRRVNNTPGIAGVNVYATIQAAHDAATAGDTIFVEPSATPYATFDCSKKLIFIGPGFYQDHNPNSSFNKGSATIAGANFNTGSASSVMMGIVCSGIIYVFDANIAMTRCYIQAIYLSTGVGSSGNNFTLSKSMITALSGGYYLETPIPAGINCFISNNIILQSITNCTGSTIRNNYIGSNIDATNCILQNNIFDRRNQTGTFNVIVGLGYNAQNNLFLSSGTGLPSTGNVNSSDFANTFLTDNPNAPLISDVEFQLKAGSPAIGIGIGGTDAGPFGGASPYILSGLPREPLITNFVSPGVGNASSPMSINVTVKANN
jgi:hypothetical protein